MAVASAQVTVTTTATLLSSVDSDDRAGSALAVMNVDTVNVYLGGSSVTTGTGYRLGVGESMTMELGPTETLYGIVGSGSASVHVLRVSV